MNSESPYAVLAQILTSNKVGLRHVHLIGELIVAQAELNEPAGPGEDRLSLTDIAVISERVANAEDNYKELWREIDGSGRPIGPEGLRRLQAVLEETVSTFLQIGEEIRSRPKKA